MEGRYHSSGHHTNCTSSRTTRCSFHRGVTLKSFADLRRSPLGSLDNGFFHIFARGPFPEGGNGEDHQKYQAKNGP